jgi:hypothetical protein
MALILPILSIHLDGSSHSQEWKKMTVSAVLSLASFNAMAFKKVLGNMDIEERGRLQSALRSALEDEQEVTVQELAKPSISLKLDFESVE